MKKFTALLLVISFLGMHCVSYKQGEGMNLESGQIPGANIIVQKINGFRLAGELIAVKETSLLLKDSGSGADVTFPLDEISVLSIVGKSQAMRGGGLGGAAGLVVGAVAASDGDEWINSGTIIGAMCGIGFILGAVIGNGIQTLDRIIDLEGLSDEELDQVMNDLRELARIPDST